MIEKEITKFEKEILLQQRIEQLETELKEFSDLQKKVYSERLQKSIVGLENRILRAKKIAVQQLIQLSSTLIIFDFFRHISYFLYYLRTFIFNRISYIICFIFIIISYV